MSHYKIKPCKLSEADHISLKSILELCQKRLNTPWQLIEQGQADLYIYSFNNPDSLAAFNQHNTGFSALISNDDTAIDNVDIVLKKPLRANNFAQVLNKIEEKIKFNSQA